MRNRTLGVTVVLAVASLVGACGGDEDTTAAGAATTTPTGGSGGTGATGGSGGSGGGSALVPVEEPCLDGAAGGPALMPWANSWTMGTQAQSNAGFLSQLTTADRRCQWHAVTDDCTVYNCLAEDWTGDQAEMRSVDAGAITIRGGVGNDVVIELGPDGAYHGEVFSSTRWFEGDQITWSAAGGTFPAFELSSTFPSAAVVTEPDFTQSAPLAIDASAPLDLQWTPTDEKMLAMLTVVARDQADDWDRKEIWCSFDGADGAGTMPAEALDHANASDADHSSAFGLVHFVERCYRIGDSHVQTFTVSGPFMEATVQ